MFIINFLPADFLVLTIPEVAVYFTDQVHFASAKSLSAMLSVLMIDMAETLI